MGTEIALVQRMGPSPRVTVCSKRVGEDYTATECCSSINQECGAPYGFAGFLIRVGKTTFGGIGTGRRAGTRRPTPFLRDCSKVYCAAFFSRGSSLSKLANRMAITAIACAP